jgi:hypothetical protein
MFLPWNHFSTSHFLLETHCRAFNYTNLPMTGNEFTYKPFLFKLGKQGREFCWNNTFLLSHTILNLTQSLNLKAWQRERERDRVQSTGLWCWSPVQLYLNLSILRVYKVILSVGSSVVNNICEIDIHVTKWFLIKEQRNNMKFFISVKRKAPMYAKNLSTSHHWLATTTIAFRYSFLNSNSSMDGSSS